MNTNYTDLSLEDVVDLLNDGKRVKAEDISPSLYGKKVVAYSVHFPGCLSESFGICLTKKQAIESLLMIAENDEGFPRGMKTELQRGVGGGIVAGGFQFEGMNYTYEQQCLLDLLH